MFKWLEKQLERHPFVVIPVIAVGAVVVASASGALTKIAQPVARAFNEVKAKLGIAPVVLFLLLAGIAGFLLFPDALPEGVALAGISPALFGYKQIHSEAYPLKTAAASHTPQSVRFDLKRFLTDEIVSGLYVRVAGNITKAGAGDGAATGKENPEALIARIMARSTPSLGTISKSALSARGIVMQGLFDRGFAILETDVTDSAEVVAVDIKLPLTWKKPGARLPIEFGLPLKAFQSYEIEVLCGGREQLFTGGTTTWDLSALAVELWADFDRGVGGKFHLTEEFEEVVPVLQTRANLPVDLPEGYVYDSLLFMAERDEVLVADIINSISIESAGRVWLPFGQGNAAMLQRHNLEQHFTNASETQTGLYYFAGVRDGMVSRAPDMKLVKPDVKLDVTLGAGTVRRVVVHGRRLIPLALIVA